MGRRVIIIGAGVSGLASACLLAKAGYKVEVYEKSSQPGGKLGYFEAKGFRFDSGPSWLLMKDVYEHFFELLGEDFNQLFDLQRLSPSYQIFFKNTLLGPLKIYGELGRDIKTLEQFEPNSSQRLMQYIEQANQQYQVAKQEFLYKNYNSKADFYTPKLLKAALKLNVLSNVQKFVNNQFESKEVRTILQYPLAFLGTPPEKAPAIYALMSHLDFNQGVYYPKGGMYELTKTLVRLAKKLGVNIHLNQPVQKILTKNNRACGVMINDQEVHADIIISNAGVQATENVLLEKKHQSYSQKYWRQRLTAPASLLIHLGVNKKYPRLEHHNLIFAKDWQKKFSKLVKGKQLPKDPSLYICCPSKTDNSVAPEGQENLFILVPIPNGIDGNLDIFADQVLETLEITLNLTDLRKHIVYKRVSAEPSLGLAHTLKQSAAFRPRNQHKKLPNLLFAGADTTPGIGLPMCLISAELAYKRIIDDSSSGPLKTPIS